MDIDEACRIVRECPVPKVITLPNGYKCPGCGKTWTTQNGHRRQGFIKSAAQRHVTKCASEQMTDQQKEAAAMIRQLFEKEQ